MKVKNATYGEISHAVKDIQAKYENNISVFIQTEGKHYKVLLRVKNANVKHGSVKGRKLNQCYYQFGTGMKSNGSACWHVHGDFFDSLLRIQPNAVIVTQYGAIDKNGGNWIDHQKGSLMNPIMYSELCECY